PDRRHDRAEVLGREPAEGRGQGRLAPGRPTGAERRPPRRGLLFPLAHEHTFAYDQWVQLRLDAADRLVELVEERRGAVPVEEAAQALFALAHLPEGMARSLLGDVVDSDARLAWRGGGVALAVCGGERLPLEQAAY